MSGAGSRIKEKIKKPAEFATRTILSGGTSLISDATGIKGAGYLVNPIGNLTGESLGNVAEKYVDDPKAARKQAKELQARQDEENRATLERFRQQRKQQAAVEEADEQRRSSRRRQLARSSRGRRGTILSDSIGQAGDRRQTLIGF